MIRKLKAKFVLVNMILITIVLGITFIAVYVSTFQRLYNDSEAALQRALKLDTYNNPTKRDIGGARPDKMEGMLPTPPIPTFCVIVSADGHILDILGEDVTISDDAVLQEIVQQCLDSKSSSGTISDQALRFMKQSTVEGTKIAFADKSDENRSLTSLVETSLLVGLGSLTAFFGISLFLASWVLKPVAKSWEQQKQFVADASHELRTPLTVILANAGIVLSHKQDTVAHQAKWIEYIQAEAQRMTTLVNDLLYLAKTDDAKSKVVLSRLDFSDTVWSCLLPFESVAFEKDKVLESDISPGIPLLGDESRLKQLLVILLDNACKYSGDKGVITVSLTENQDRVKLTVNNTGMPISPEQLAHIFERFYRVDQSRARENGGYGLGLAIAKSIVETHNGRIAVQSTAEYGTTFSITFPSVKAEVPKTHLLGL